MQYTAYDVTCSQCKTDYAFQLPNTPLNQQINGAIPDFYNVPQIIELLSTENQYRTIIMSTAHLSPDDQLALDVLSTDKTFGLVMKRDTGWFLKLYDEIEPIELLSKDLNELLTYVQRAGYHMIEFDCDGDVYRSFRTNN